MNTPARVRRLCAGSYTVGSRWAIERTYSNDARWMVIRFAPDSEEVERREWFGTYREARQHAIIESTADEWGNNPKPKLSF